MIKTMFASASTFAYVGCIAVCCMGNEYPAKAACSDRSWGGREYCENFLQSGRAAEQRYQQSVRDAEFYQLQQEVRNPRSY